MRDSIDTEKNDTETIEKMSFVLIGCSDLDDKNGLRTQTLWEFGFGKDDIVRLGKRAANETRLLLGRSF